MPSRLARLVRRRPPRAGAAGMASTPAGLHGLSLLQAELYAILVGVAAVSEFVVLLPIDEWMEGVAEPEHIDEIMKLGCAHPMGPLRLADFIGLDVCHDIMMVLYRELGDSKFFPCPLLRQLVTAGRLGDKTCHGVYNHSEG